MSTIKGKDVTVHTQISSLKKVILACLNVFYIFFLFPHELRWDWSVIDPTDIFFPPTFLWGCADSALQTEGIVTAKNKTINNSWTDYETRNPHLIPKHSRVGVACERWTRYKSDIQLLKNIGMNSYRFSIEWSKIEPEEGVFDHEAMQHYCDMVTELCAQNIQPVPTLFHHTYPLWFSKKKGFEKRENMVFFARFATYVFKHLHAQARMWILFNEPIGYALEAYYRGNYPPAKTSLRLAGKVARNILNTHVMIAKVFKKINPDVSLGIAHIMQPLDPYHPWNIFELITARTFHYIVNNLLIDFFKTGTFNWLYLVRDTNLNAPQSLDFIGINYYSHTLIKQEKTLALKPSSRSTEKIIDQPSPGRAGKALYPEGLYRAIRRASQLNLPIYITENGCSTQDRHLKEEYLKTHLYVLSKALNEGYNIKGYFFWTLMDSFCWRKGYRDKHGIYAVNFTTQERTLRNSADYLLHTIKRFSRQL